MRFDRPGAEAAHGEEPERENVDRQAQQQGGGREQTGYGEDRHAQEIVVGGAGDAPLPRERQSCAPKAHAAYGGAQEREGRPVVDNGVPHLAGEEGKLCHVEDNIVIGDFLQEAIKEFSRGLDGRGLRPIDPLAIGDIISLFMKD